MCGVIGSIVLWCFEDCDAVRSSIRPLELVGDSLDWKKFRENFLIGSLVGPIKMPSLGVIGVLHLCRGLFNKKPGLY